MYCVNIMPPITDIEAVRIQVADVPQEHKHTFMSHPVKIKMGRNRCIGVMVVGILFIAFAIIIGCRRHA